MKYTVAVNSLENLGFNVVCGEGYKNGIQYRNISVGSGCVKACIWEYQIESIESVEELELIVKNGVKNAPNFDNVADLINSAEYVKANVITCIRPISKDTEALSFTTQYDGIEEYFRINLSGYDHGQASVIVKRDMFPNSNYTIDELKKWARENTERSIRIQHMSEVFAEMGVPMPVSEPMYVMSNANRLHGASAILCKDVLKTFCIEHGFNEITIIPSSVHEVILLPKSDEPSELANMIKEVNETQVDITERLSNRPYSYSIG